MTRRLRLGWGLAIAALASLAALSVWYGGRAALADAGALRATGLVKEWQAGRGPAFSPALWLKTRDSLRQAAAMTPGNASLFDGLGYLHGSRAQGLGNPVPDTPLWTYRHDLLRRAIESYRTATRLRPTFPYSWTNLALVKLMQGEQDNELWLAFDKGMQYGSRDVSVQPLLALIAFAQWVDLTVERQARVAAMVASASALVRSDLLDLAAQSGVTLPTSAAL
jgi:hypothetical protein